MESEVMLKLDKIRKVFFDSYHKREVVAVEEFSIEIQKGQMITLLGPSGCGKTTVLRMVAGFEQPTSGDLFLRGKRVNDLPANQRNSAMVFQSYALFPHMSVRQNIAYGLKLRGLKTEIQKEKLAKIVEVVGLQGYEDRRPNELSGGQQQRVALARALVVEPDLLLFDEPLSNLDAKLREAMRRDIRRLQQSLGITALYVTHDQEEAMAISDRVVVMNKARIEQIGSPEEVYFKPKTKFVSDFMGGANILDAVVEKVDENGVEVKIDGGSIRMKRSSVKVQANDKVWAVVRPEAFLVATDASSGGLQAEVLQSLFLGRDWELECVLQNKAKVRVRHPAVFGGEHFEAGQKIYLSAKPDAARVVVH